MTNKEMLRIEGDGREAADELLRILRERGVIDEAGYVRPAEKSTRPTAKKKGEPRAPGRGRE